MGVSIWILFLGGQLRTIFVDSTNSWKITWRTKKNERKKRKTLGSKSSCLLKMKEKGGGRNYRGEIGYNKSVRSRNCTYTRGKG